MMFRSSLHRRAAISLLALAAGLCAGHLAAQGRISGTSPTEFPPTGPTGIPTGTPFPAPTGSPVPLQYSYNAPDPIVVSGNVTIQRGTPAPAPASEVYTINSPTAVLDFTIDRGSDPVFQNAGTTVTYQNGVNTPDFTVLNRITGAAGAIEFDGTVLSRLRDATGTAVPGGTVWFYSPGGIVIGADATFDVGSLLLTTADPTGGTGVIGDVNRLNLVTNVVPGTLPGIEVYGTITASPNNSYVAIVAPRIQHYGSTTVNGGAAFVAAESATLTINQGLFDIQVAVGSDGFDYGYSGGEGEGSGTSNGPHVPLELYGTVTGAGPTTAAQHRAIYAVAVPKNEAITMLVAPGGQLGFTAATGVTIENGAIYLQAGDGVTVAPGAPITTRLNLPTRGPADISLTLGSVTSPLVAQASRSLEAYAAPPIRGEATGPTEAGPTLPNPSLDGGGYFYGGSSARLDVYGVAAPTTFGPITIQSFGPAGPGLAELTVDASELTIAGGLAIHADPTGRTLPVGWSGAAGGVARLFNTGTLTVASIAISADGSAATENAAGGTASIDSQGVTRVSGAVSLDANATVTGPRATAQGGDAQLVLDGGSLTAGQLDLRAVGTAAGGATGGNALITMGEGSGSFDVAGSVGLDARGRSGDLTTAVSPAGNTTGGTAAIMLGDGLTSRAGAILLDASAQADGRSGAANPNAAVASGGTVTLGLAGNTVLNATDVTLRAVGEAAGSSIGAVGAAGGGSAGVTVDGTLGVNSLSLVTDATGGSIAGGNAAPAAASAGSSLVTVDAGGQLNARDLVSLSAVAQGGQAAGGSAAGGNAAGGTAALTVAAMGQVRTAAINARVDATGGAATGGRGGTGLGGVATVQADGAIVTGALSATAIGRGGVGFAGGDGTGGMVTTTASAGALTASGSVLLNAGGIGGDALATAGGGGVGQGGAATLDWATGALMVGDATIGADGQGGRATGGRGGRGTGGAAAFGSGQSGAVTFASGTLSAQGRGGATATGTGGDGIGGSADLQIGSGRIATATTGQALRLLGSATGGDATGGGGAGGAALGGNARVTASTGRADTTSLLQLAAGAVGGGATTGTAGTARGGTASLTTSGNAALTFRSVSANAAATGSAATGGQAMVAIGSGRLDANSLLVNVDANGATAAGGTVSLTSGSGVVAIAQQATVSAAAMAGGSAGTGGTIRVRAGTTAASGIVDLAQATLVANQLVAIGAVDGLASAGDVRFASLAATAGSRIEAGQNLTLRSGDATLTSGGTVLTRDLAGPGIITVSAATASALGNVTAGGPVRLTAGGDLTAGNLRGGSIYALAGGQLRVGAPTIGTGGTGDGSVTLISGQALTVGDIGAPGGVALAARGGSLAAGAITGGGDVVLLARDGVTATSVRAGGVAKIGNAAEPGAGTAPLTLAATPAMRIAGAVQVAGAVGGARVDIATATGITATSVAATGAARLDSGGGVRLTTLTAGSASVGGAGTVAIDSTTTSGALAVATAGDIALGAVASGGAASLTATGGRLSVARASRATGALDLAATTITTAALTSDVRVAATAAGPITVGDIAAPVVRLSADGALSTRAITATQSIALTGSTVAIDGAVAAPAITLTGGDLAIGTAGTLGGGAGSTVAITALPSVATIALGDATGASGFAIDQAEFARIGTGALAIGGAVTGAPRVVIGNLALTAGTGAGRIGALSVATGGDLAVVGALRLSNADAQSAVALAAGGGVTVRTDTGWIALTGTGGALAGTLSIRGRDVLVGAPDFIGAAPGQTTADLARAAAALSTTPTPDGVVRAGGIDLGAARLIAVQNSGTAQTAAGLLAGGGGLTLTSTAATGALPLVIINGAVPDGSGVLAVNGDTRRFIRLARSGQAASASDFAPASTVNGCALALTTPCLIGGGTVADDPAVAAIAPSVRAEVGELVGLESSALGTRLTIGVQSLIDATGVDAAGLISDPIGSAGNPAFWEPGKPDEEERRRRAGKGGTR